MKIRPGASVYLNGSLATLVFVALTTVAGLQRVQAQALSPVKPPLKVVQLGNSYSAGNGARDADGNRNYTGVEGCYRSNTNWGSQFVDTLRDVFAITYVNRACSGGVIADITSPRARALEQDTVDSDDACFEASFPDEELIIREENASSATCTRTVRPQIEGVDESTDLVLMTGGGNDARFADVVKECFATGFRDGDSCRAAVDFGNGQLDTIEADLIATLAELRSRMRSDARVVVVTYPHLVPDVAYTLNSSEGEYAVSEEVRRFAIAADEKQQAAITAANLAAGEEFAVLFDGTKELFEGHLPNPFQSESRNPDRWIYEFESFTYRNVEPYHYNALGHSNLAASISLFDTFGATGGTFESATDIDVVFVVDTTGSMGGEIAQVRRDLSELVSQLAETTNSFRVAVVSYRDFPERTGSSIDYPARVDQSFSSELSVIQAAIDSLSASGGGDFPETAFSGIDAAIGLGWRPGVSKIMLVIGDAPAFSPEPISGLTAAGLIQDSINVDPVKIVGVDVGALDSNAALTELADGTGGTVVRSGSDLTATISSILDTSVREPFAWMGVSYSRKTGEAINFDASGSFDPSGQPLRLYEWDFDGDGTFDATTSEPEISHVYTEDNDAFAILRVTGEGGTALGSSRVVTNAQGFVSQGDELACEVDEDGLPIFVDENGIFLRCTATDLPLEDAPGVVAASGIRITLPSGEWAQHALPASFAEQSIGDLFGSELNVDDYGLTWVVFTYDGNIRDYNMPGVGDSLMPGMGFWIIQVAEDEVSVDLPVDGAALELVNTAGCQSDSGCTRLPLATDAESGTWTMAGTPLIRPIDVEDVVIATEVSGSSCEMGCSLAEAASAGLVRTELFSYNASLEKYDDLVTLGAIAPARGYWLFTDPASSDLSPVLLLPVDAVAL